MSPEEVNSASVRSYIDTLSARKYAALLSFFASPSSNYWVNGSPARSFAAGDMAVSERMKQMEIFMDNWHQWSFTITNLVAQGNKVMLEGIGRGEGAPGSGYVYRQTAVMAFDMQEGGTGKILEKREYIDHEEFPAAMAYFEQKSQASQSS